jgi:hypothetical protein
LNEKEIAVGFGMINSAVLLMRRLLCGRALIPPPAAVRPLVLLPHHRSGLRVV